MNRLFLRSHKPLWPSDSRWSHISVGLKLTFQGQFNQVEKRAEISGIHAELPLTSCAPLSRSNLQFGAESCSSVFGDFVKNGSTIQACSFGDPKHSGCHLPAAAAAFPSCSPQPNTAFLSFGGEEAEQPTELCPTAKLVYLTQMLLTHFT